MAMHMANSETVCKIRPIAYAYGWLRPRTGAAGPREGRTTEAQKFSSLRRQR